MKLIKTNILRKYGHNSDLGIATASHLDYCHYMYQGLKSNYSLQAIFGVFIEFLERLLFLVTAPFFVITHGIILYPVWIIHHIICRKEIIKKYGVDHINKNAEQLSRQLEEDEARK